MRDWWRTVQLTNLPDPANCFTEVTVCCCCSFWSCHSLDIPWASQVSQSPTSEELSELFPSDHLPSLLEGGGVLNEDCESWEPEETFSLSFRSHRDSIVKTCNFHIHNLYMIKDFVNRKNLVTLVHSLTVSKVDYCNSLFIRLPNVILKKSSVFNLPPRVPTTSSLIELLWSLTSHPILGNFCLFPPMNPPRVCEVQVTLTIYTNLELLERGDLPIVLFLTLPRIYIINCQLQLNRLTL